MIPTGWTILEALPLTPSGKLDRRAPGGLAQPDPGVGLRTSYAPPRTEAEKTVAVIWREVLGLEKVGLDDNFFDLGGHSLLVTRVQAGLAAVCGRTIPVVEMFRYTTVRALAGYLSSLDEAAVSADSAGKRSSPAGTAAEPARTGRERAERRRRMRGG